MKTKKPESIEEALALLATAAQELDENNQKIIKSAEEVDANLTKQKNVLEELAAIHKAIGGFSKKYFAGRGRRFSFLGR